MAAHNYDYDLFVIGAGSGGVRASRMSATYGAKVAVAEEYRVGGTCVIRGCIPKKLFAYASRFGEAFEDAPGFGWSLSSASFDWPALVANKDKEIDRLDAIYVRNLKSAGVELVRGRAVVEDPNTIRLTGQFEGKGRRVTAETILIATGSKPFVPEVAGAEHAITSNEAFHLETFPNRIVIVGGGYIAVEFAGIFAGLGAGVTLLYRGPQILRGFDDDVRDGLAQEMAKRGIDVRVKCEVTAISPSTGAYELTLGSGDTLSCDCVMYATGRIPNTSVLGLEKVGVALGWNGHVVVDEYSRSSRPNIYAVGDVTHRVNLTPVAIQEGAAFAATLYNNTPTPVDHAFIPTAVFSAPEIGTVGLTEVEAREMYHEVDIYKSAFKPLKHTLSGRDTAMLMKIVVDGESGRVLGCHILGEDAAEMAQVLAIALRMGVTKAQFDATMALHPSAAEELVTMTQKWRPQRAKAAE